MSNVRKRISDLTALTSASLDTVVVGVDNGTTYKIELDVLADAVTSRVNILDRNRLSSLESVTSSFETKGRSVISSSAQITALGFTSSSANLNSLNDFTSSQATLNTAFTNGINGKLATSSFESFSSSIHSEIIAATNEQSLTHLVTTSSFNEYTASISTASLVDRLNQIENVSGSWITESETGSFLTSLNGAISSSSQLTSSYDSRYVLSGSITQTTWDNISGKPAGLVSQSTDLTSLNSFTASNANTSLNAATSSYETKGSGIISGSSQLTSSFDTRYTLSGSVQPLPNGLISGSSQLTSSFDTRYAPSASYLTSLNGAYSSSIQTLGGSGVYSSSAQLPSGLISGSSQLTASYDTRYTLSGSVVSGTTPTGTISGSSQLTSSFDGRYVQTGSFNTLTASFNSFTASAQAVTTGSNSFNGTQTITGSLIITTGSFIGSQIVANTSSLYLTSGSNMYVQNNGVVEITGSLIVNGTTRFATVGGDEGGEIEFGVPQTNTTLSTSVKADIYQNRFRIFDGNTNGVYVDLSKAPTGVNGELTWKASGMVNAGTFVQLDNIKVTVTSSGQRGLSLATVSGSYTYSIGGTYGAGVGTGGASTTGTLTTTPTASIFGWGFTATGDISTYVLTDTTNNRCYRITLQIGGSFNNNSIVIERLH